MLTTKQVRAIIAKHEKNAGYGVYTNKTAGDTSDNRRVKCYYRNNLALFLELQKAAGVENVRITNGASGWYANGKGIIVKCVLA
jgi:hypothetical protein